MKGRMNPAVTRASESSVVEGSAYSDVERKGLIAWLKNNV